MWQCGHYCHLSEPPPALNIPTPTPAPAALLGDTRESYDLPKLRDKPRQQLSHLKVQSLGC